MAKLHEPSPNRAPIPPTKHWTVHVEEVHTVGPDRRPVSHKVMQSIVALAPLASIPYYFDTDEYGGIDCIRGCQLGEARQVEGTPHLYMAELLLGSSLERGEGTILEYTTRFNYKQPPPPEYRRRIGSGVMSTLDITVQFAQDYAPEHVWEAQWLSASPDSSTFPDSVIDVEPRVAPGLPDLVAVQRQESNIQPGVVLGFKWEW